MISACAKGQRPKTHTYVVAVVKIPIGQLASAADYNAGFRCAIDVEDGAPEQMRAKMHDAVNTIADMMADIP